MAPWLRVEMATSDNHNNNTNDNNNDYNNNDNNSTNLLCLLYLRHIISTLVLFFHMLLLGVRCGLCDIDR